MKEKRYVKSKVELRKQEGGRVLIGMPVVYNEPSELIYGMFREFIKPGAFDEWIDKRSDILCLKDHNPNKLLGRTASGTLQIAKGERGLEIECKLPNTTYAIDLAEMIERGDITGMSFGFDVLDDEWYMQDGVRCRDVTRGEVYEFSYVTMPAYPASEAGLRDIEAMKREIEAKLKTPKRDILKAKLRILQR